MAIERELKFQLDEARYEQLKIALGQAQAAKQQTNLYLDSPQRDVTQAHGSLRLRREGEELTCCYKRGISQKGSFFEIQELEVKVSQEQWDKVASGQFPEGTLEPLDRLRHDFPHVEQLVRLGQVQNLRLCFPLPTGDLAELDRTEFPGGRVDFELEVETENPAEVEVHLTTLGIRLTPQTKTKFRRFLDALGQ